MVREGSGLPIEESALWNHEPACWGWGRKQLCLHRLNSRKACKGRCLAEGLQACDMPHIYMWTKVACGRGIRAGHHLCIRPHQGLQQAKTNINIANKHHASISSCPQSVHSRAAVPYLRRDQSYGIRTSRRKERKPPRKQKVPNLTELS